MPSYANGSILGNNHETIDLIMNNKSKLFNVLVVGENPEQIIGKYDSNTRAEARRIYEYAKAEEYKRNYLNSLRNILASYKDGDGPINPEILQEEISDIESMSAQDYYFEMVAEPGIELDEVTCDAYSTDNPDGKFISHRIAGYFALPLILKDGREVYTALKGEVDWDKVHLANQHPYEVAWDTVVEGKTPNGPEEHNIYENMKNRTHYFTNFESRAHYIAASTAFWEYAYVDENGWVELDGKQPQFDWVINFFDRFVKPLPDDARLTIYECAREQNA